MTIQATGRQADPVRPQPQLSIGQITAAQQLLLPKTQFYPIHRFTNKKAYTALPECAQMGLCSKDLSDTARNEDITNRSFQLMVGCTSTRARQNGRGRPTPDTRRWSWRRCRESSIPASGGLGRPLSWCLSLSGAS